MSNSVLLRTVAVTAALSVSSCGDEGHRRETPDARVSPAHAEGGSSKAPDDDASAPSKLDAATQPLADASAGSVDASHDASASVPSCKRGVAYGEHSAKDMKALSASVHWWYNWSPTPESAVRDVYAMDGVEFVPMAWGRFDATKLASQIPNGSHTLLAFNEPNFKSQANLSAKEAAALWPDLERIADQKGLTLASPALNYCGPASNCWDTDPISYLDDFFSACTNCRVDSIAAHWYACDGPALQSYLSKLEKYDKPIWLTEFSCGDGSDRSLDKQKAYMREAVAILEASPKVARYAWFSARTTAIPNVALLDGDGALTELGKLYLSLPHEDARCAR